MLNELRISIRYIFSSESRNKVSSIMIFLGIAFSLAALLITTGIMNGLQSNIIDDLRNVESFDVKVGDTSLTEDQLRNIEGVQGCYEFADYPALLTYSSTNETKILRIRAIEPSFFDNNKYIRWLADKSDSEKNISVSYSVLNTLNLTQGSKIELTFLKPGKTTRLSPYKFETYIDGVFLTSLPEFNSTTLFGDISWFKELSPKTDSTYGLITGDEINTVVKNIQKMDPDASITTWKEANKATYSAFVLEKTLMMFFLFFLFLVIAVNLKNSTRRLLNAKRSESGMLRAMGMERRRVKSIFLLQAIIISISGIVFGLVLCYLFASNIDGVLKFTDSIVSLFSGNKSFLSMVNLTISLHFSEIFILCLAVLFVSVIFSVAGASKVFKKNIMEVILNDENS